MISMGRRVNAESISSGLRVYIIGAPRMAWSMNTSLNHVSGNALDRSRAASNIAEVGNVIPENVNAITA